MTLDPTPDVATLLRMKAEREAKAVGPKIVVTATTAANTTGSGGPRAVGRPKGQHTETEHDIQAALFEKVNDPAEQAKRPALALVHAVPNGGARTPATAGKLKAEGVKPGVPDIDCPVARGGWFGLRIEMKRPGETTTPAQADWLYQLKREGYQTALHTTAEGAWAELCAYLDQPRTLTYQPHPRIA